MILTQLTLRNFCLYRGEQTLDLSPGTRHGEKTPIVLFGGINGGGKTTLLDAVQLVLYGVRAKCSKRADKTYEQFLRESIHRGADASEGASIQLAFHYAAQGQERLYEVARSWSEASGRIREKVRVCRDGQADGWLSDNWSQVVEELIPFGIAQLCFFDAEKIRFLAEDETSTQALGDAIKSLLGLDLVERLVTDAGVLEGRVARRTRKSADLNQLDQLETALEAKRAEVGAAVQERASLQNQRHPAKTRLAKAEEAFAETGGEHWLKRDRHRQEHADREREVQEASERLVALAAGELPLSLVEDLLRQVARQAGRERQVAEARIVAKLLEDRDRALLRALKRRKVDPAAVKLVASLLAEDRSGREPADQARSRLRLSEAARRLLENLLDGGLATRRAEAENLVERIEAGRRKLEDLERAIAATPKEDTIRGLADELKQAAALLAAIDQQIARIDKTIDSLRSEQRDLETRLGRVRRKVVDEQIHGEQSARIASLLVRTQEVMSEFLQQATARKIDRLSRLVTESFRFLLRKASLVHRVLIDPRTFAITLFDDDGRMIEKQRLSEGEKQIFAISVLWGLSRASARPLPAIIDTPMARLDAKHRQKLVTRYFPHASHQVVILSTDTEIEREYFHQLQPHIARAYHLSYDEKQKMTIAEEGYFWDTQSAANPREADK